MAIEKILVPDIGSFDSVDVIEVIVKVGDTIKKDDSLITLESDKASMDIPAPHAGTVKEILLKVGDKIKQGSPILMLDVVLDEKKAETKTEIKETKKEEAPKASIPEPSRPAPEPPQKIKPQQTPAPIGDSVAVAPNKKSHASPSVRKFARELGVNLAFVQGSGPKNRILESDIQSYVKGELARPRTDNMGNAPTVIPMPVIDFSQYGDIETIVRQTRCGSPQGSKWRY
jgi:pyruvate dehydrogenase E2 component (dihydrolipoamide acetyltransferase)